MVAAPLTPSTRVTAHRLSTHVPPIKRLPRARPRTRPRLQSQGLPAKRPRKLPRRWRPSSPRRHPRVHLGRPTGGLRHLRPRIGQGKSGGATYYCATNRLYLYERSPQNWCVGKKAGGKSCKAYDSKGWHFYLEKKWTKRSDVTLTFGSESTSTDVEAFAVECRYSNLAGGYKKTDRVECDRPVFRNEEKSKELWLGPDGQWCFSDAAGVDEEGDYDAFLESAEGENASSPEVADWADQHVHIHPVDIQAIEALHKSMEGDQTWLQGSGICPRPGHLGRGPRRLAMDSSREAVRARPRAPALGRRRALGYYAGCFGRLLAALRAFGRGGVPGVCRELAL